jgi:enediyne biosynthesis protein E4
VTVEVIWPSGRKDSVPNVKPNQFITIQEGKGLTAARTIP